MPSHLKTLAITTFLATLVTFRSGAAAALLDQKLIVNGIAATVSVTPVGRNNFWIDAEFRSSTFPVGCLSAYRDLQYELRSERGRLIPVNPQALNRPQQEQSTVIHVVKGSTGHPCSWNAQNGMWNPHALFSILYPGLPAGKYVLRISFAPRGTGHSADFKTVPISIKAST